MFLSPAVYAAESADVESVSMHNLEYSFNPYYPYRGFEYPLPMLLVLHKGVLSRIYPITYADKPRNSAFQAPNFAHRNTRLSASKSQSNMDIYASQPPNFAQSSMKITAQCINLSGVLVVGLMLHSQQKLTHASFKYMCARMGL